MPTARRDRYEWEYILSAIEILRDSPEDFVRLGRFPSEERQAIESEIQKALEANPHTGAWTRIPVLLTAKEQTFVNRELANMTMVRISFPLERLDLLGLHAVEEEYAEIQDRVLYLTTNSPKDESEDLSLWVAHPDIEWLEGWIAGCTTPDGELR